MIYQIKEYINHHQLLPEKIKTIFAAISGGIDSCVMLDILIQLQKELKYKIQIIHINHGTRGTDNLKDETLIEKLAIYYKIPFIIKKLENNKVKQSEVYLREQRYKIFNQILKNNNSSIIATAHNADDNVETVLMRFFRGSNLKGLTGIQPKRGLFIRPLLGQSRSAIQYYAVKNKIRYRDDYTNFNSRITRNFIRNDLIPLLQNKMNTDIHTNITKSLEDLSQHYKLFSEILKSAIGQVVKRNKQVIQLNKNKYKQYNTLIRKGLIEYCISGVQPLNYGISSKNFLLWDEFIKKSKPGKKKNILDAGFAISERKDIIFGDFPKERKDSYKLILNSEIIIDNKYRIEFKEVNKNQLEFNVNKNIEFIDGDKTGKILLIRFWQKGDTFKPLGMKQRRKLSDFFIDLKLSVRRKKEVPIICKNDKIVWVAGYRLDDQFKISDGTIKYYQITITEVAKDA